MASSPKYHQPSSACSRTIEDLEVTELRPSDSDEHPPNTRQVHAPRADKVNVMGGRLEGKSFQEVSARGRDISHDRERQALKS